jgi:uncharacterized protein
VKNYKQVMAAEAYLRQAGFGTVRVRVHDKLARIEVPRSTNQ